ncbi:ATP-binding protein [Alkalihalobacillus sp. MEB130]|uniref:ATP-binding protein n=1 Tax=Alkalihalobacillus sp. MEB130 TaxID=2976704 RepID=UPI0028E054C4|nr:ATP-binding protein [Alkalihalobacillus sp. MEB130]MDT8859218.1 ATP-binding protein [Alkalihalobacillus sp. MEB130]
MKLITKLTMGLGSILVIIIILSVTVFYSLTQQNEYMRGIVTEDHQRVMLAESFKNEVSIIARESRELLLLEQGDPLINETISNINEAQENQLYILDILQQMSTFGEGFETSTSSMQHLSTAYNDMIQTVVSLVISEDYNEARNFLLKENQDLRRNMITEVDLFVEEEQASMLERLSRSEEAYESAIRYLVILTIVALVIIVVITYSLIKGINSSINSVRKVITSVNEHSIEELPRIEVTTRDEIADIAIAYNAMAESLEKISSQEKQFANSLKEENWIKSRYAEIAMKFQGINELHEFGKVLLTNVSQFVGATYGAIYIKEEGNTLSKFASYAGIDNEVGIDKFHLGQGLVGQCAADKKRMILDHLPKGYISTRSGLGEAAPTSLILLPIEFEGEILGVIELAKFEPFSDAEIRILEQLSQSSGSSIERILDHMKIEELLAESQTQSEELQTQSEELQQQQEELRLINEQLHEQFKQSDEKKQELELIKKDLEEKNRNIKLGSRYKSEFLANMSHELRTPLNSMLILSQMLAENSTGNLSEKQVDYASTIYSSGQDLLELINDILDLSKIESGKVDVYPEEVLIGDIKAFVERQFAPISSQKGIDLTILVDRSSPTIVCTDDQRLKQILKNLLSNAFKFTDEGQVELHIKDGKEEDGIKVVFSVIDTGIGISLEKQQSIFDAFYQEDGTITRKYGGTGLGLSISRELSELLGGYIEVESTEGKGSTFTLHLPDYQGEPHVHQTVLPEVASALDQDVPLDESKVEPDIVEISHSYKTADQERTEEKLQNKTVLIVDDDMRNVFSLTAALEMQNMTVLFAENGIEALETLQDQPNIDIVLMDIMMPEMNGYEAMEEIRKNKEWADLPILALTAKAMKNDREKCIRAGASDYISKPVNMEQLLSLMKVWLHK